MCLHTFPSNTTSQWRRSHNQHQYPPTPRCLFSIAPLPFVYLINCYEGSLFNNVRSCFKKLLPNFNQSSILALPPHYSRSSQDALVHFLYHSWAAFLLFNRASPQLRLSVFLLLSFISHTHTHLHFFFFFWLQVPIVNFLSACFCAHYPLTGFEWIESPLGADLFEFQMMIRDWFIHTRQSNFFSL